MEDCGKVGEWLGERFWEGLGLVGKVWGMVEGGLGASKAQGTE